MGSPTTVLAKITRSYPVRLPWWPCGHFVGQGGLPFWAFSFLPFFWKNGNMLFHPNVVSTTCFFSDLTHEKENWNRHTSTVWLFLLNARMLQCVWKKSSCWSPKVLFRQIWIQLSSMVELKFCEGMKQKQQDLLIWVIKYWMMMNSWSICEEWQTPRQN